MLVTKNAARKSLSSAVIPVIVEGGVRQTNGLRLKHTSSRNPFPRVLNNAIVVSRGHKDPQNTYRWGSRRSFATGMSCRLIHLLNSLLYSVVVASSQSVIHKPLFDKILIANRQVYYTSLPHRDLTHLAEAKSHAGSYEPQDGSVSRLLLSIAK